MSRTCVRACACMYSGEEACTCALKAAAVRACACVSSPHVSMPPYKRACAVTCMGKLVVLDTRMQQHQRLRKLVRVCRDRYAQGCERSTCLGMQEPGWSPSCKRSCTRALLYALLCAFVRALLCALLCTHGRIAEYRLRCVRLHELPARIYTTMHSHVRGCTAHAPALPAALGRS